MEPLIDAPVFDRDLRHQPSPARTHAGADAPAAKVQRSVDFLRAPSIDFAAPRRARELQLLACAALFGAGAAAGMGASLQELGWHLRPAAAMATLVIALAAGFAAGCWLPRVLLLGRLRRLGLVGDRGRIATLAESASDDGDTAGDFAGGAAGAMWVACGLAWLFAGIVIANLERWRAFVTDGWLLPPEALAVLVVAPALLAILVAGIATGSCVPALIGWQRTLCAAPLRAGVLGGVLLSGALGGLLVVRFAGMAAGIVLSPTMLFAAAALLAVRRKRTVTPAAPLFAPGAMGSREAVASVPLLVAGVLAASAAVIASRAGAANSVLLAAAGVAGGVWCAALARPPRGRRLLAAALLAGGGLALLTPALWRVDAVGAAQYLTAGLICGLCGGAAALAARSLLSRLRNVQRTVATAASAMCVGCACGAMGCLAVGVGSGESADWNSRRAASTGMTRIEALLRAGGLRVAHVPLGSPARALQENGIGQIDLAGRRYDALLVHASASAFDAWAVDRARASRLLRRLDAAMLPGGRVVLLAKDEAEQKRLAARVAGLRNPRSWHWFGLRVVDGSDTEFALFAGRDVREWTDAHSATTWNVLLEPIEGFASSAGP